MPSETVVKLPRVLLHLRGLVKVLGLLELPDGTVWIDASEVHRIDAFAAVVIRAALERFVQRSPGNSVLLTEPSDGQACLWFYGLLGDLPMRCRVEGTQTKPPNRADVLLPCHRLRDQEDCRQATEIIVKATARDRRPRMRLLVEAFNELAWNGLTHGASSDVDVIAAVSLEPQSRHLQLVLLDTGDPGGRDDHEYYLRQAVAQSWTANGGFSGLVGRATARARLRLLSGDARLTWLDRVNTQKDNSFLPGFLASLEVLL